MTNAMRYVMASALAVVMMTGATSLASAHTDVDCYLPKKAYCEAKHAAGSAAAHPRRVYLRRPIDFFRHNSVS